MLPNMELVENGGRSSILVRDVRKGLVRFGFDQAFNVRSS